MITRIMLARGGFNPGYVPKRNDPLKQEAFATANLAVRREAIEEVGLFDESLQTGEDMDLCLRVAASKWETYYERRAIVRHLFRKTLASFFRQWFDYAWFHPYVIKKHRRKGIAVCFPHLAWIIFHIPFFTWVILPVTPFLVFHMAVLGLLAGIYSNSKLLIILSSIVCAWTGTRNIFAPSYLRSCSLREWPLYIGIRYLLNWVYIAGGLLGGFSTGVLYLETTRD